MIKAEEKTQEKVLRVRASWISHHREAKLPVQHVSKILFFGGMGTSFKQLTKRGDCFTFAKRNGYNTRTNPEERYG